MKINELFEAGRVFTLGGTKQSKTAEPVGDPKKFRKGQKVTVKKTGQEVEVLGFTDTGLVQTVSTNPNDLAVKDWKDHSHKELKGNLFSARGHQAYMPRELQESISDQHNRADAFKSMVEAKLKPFGFRKDRELFIDSKGNVISVEIDTTDDESWVNWATGWKRGAKNRFTESGNDPLSERASIMRTLLNFAKESFKD